MVVIGFIVVFDAKNKNDDIIEYLYETPLNT